MASVVCVKQYHQSRFPRAAWVKNPAPQGGVFRCNLNKKEGRRSANITQPGQQEESHMADKALYCPVHKEIAPLRHSLHFNLFKHTIPLSESLFYYFPATAWTTHPTTGKTSKTKCQPFITK